MEKNKSMLIIGAVSTVLLLALLATLAYFYFNAS